jgi:hypothetical protein
LQDDLGENHDLSKENPAKSNELRMKLRAWQQQLGAKMPRSVEVSTSE